MVEEEQGRSSGRWSSPLPNHAAERRGSARIKRLERSKRAPTQKICGRLNDQATSFLPGFGNRPSIPIGGRRRSE